MRVRWDALSWSAGAALAACAELGDTGPLGEAGAPFPDVVPSPFPSGAGLDPVSSEPPDAFVWPARDARAGGDRDDSPSLPNPPINADAGSCAGASGHACYRPKPDNPSGCPAQIHEQSAFYPPLEEWTGCDGPWWVACVYLRPDGSEASCVCDLGFHWICAY